MECSSKYLSSAFNCLINSAGNIQASFVNSVLKSGFLLILNSMYLHTLGV